jgi:hypothetical protein
LAKKVVERLQSLFLQSDLAEIVIHKADQPNPFFDFLQTDRLTSENRAEVNLFAVETDAPVHSSLSSLSDPHCGRKETEILGGTY